MAIPLDAISLQDREVLETSLLIHAFKPHILAL